MRIDVDALKPHLKKHFWIWMLTLVGLLLLLIALLVPAIKGQIFDHMMMAAWVLPLTAWIFRAITTKEWRLLWIGAALGSILLLAG